MLVYNPDMGLDFWEGEPWFRRWRYRFFWFGPWPVNWKGWVATALFNAIGFGVILPLKHRTTPAETLTFWVAIGMTLVMLVWIIVARTEDVILRD
jgi:hypothetical protein